MYVALTEKFKNRMDFYVSKRFKEENKDLGKAIVLFEKLLNISSDIGKFDTDYCMILNDSAENNFGDWKRKEGIKIEGFLKKIAHVANIQVEYESSGALNKLYKEVIKFNKLLRSDEAKEAMKKDGFSFKQKPFSKSEANASLYTNCPGFLKEYLFVYQTRNELFHDDYDELSSEEIQSLFVVYFDVCLKYSDQISEFFDNDMGDSIDFVKYVNCLEFDLQEFDKTFLQLPWNRIGSGEDYPIDSPVFDYSSPIKFIGEAGIGKTTQLMKLYSTCIRHVASQTIKRIPVWIEPANSKESLYDQIREKTGDEIFNYFDSLSSNGMIALFIDGYNEILDESQKRNFAFDIEEYHNKYPKCYIALNDRNLKSNPACFRKNATVFGFDGMSHDEQIEYIKMKSGNNADRIIEYIESKDASWMERTVIVPEKMNILILIVSDGNTPEDEDMFYDQYFECILEREEVEKKETNIDVLKYLLGILAKNMDNENDEKSQFEIFDLWKEKSGYSITEVRRLFQLAVELPILTNGDDNSSSFRFRYPQYYFKCLNM